MSKGATRRLGRRGVLITGGGTAGHIAPALAVATALVDAGIDRSCIHFVGSRRGIEGRLVPDAGFSLTVLPGRGIKRRITASNLLAICGLGIALFEALALVAWRRPQVAVAIGGYAALPGALAAVVIRCPLVVVNLDAVPGAANRLLGRFATRCAVAFPNTDLPRAVVTGAPVRSEVIKLANREGARAASRSQFCFDPERLVLTVVGGSLGARRLNDAAIGLAQLFAGRSDLSLVQVAGPRDFDDVLTKTGAFREDPATKIDYRVLSYEGRLAELFVASDLVLSRAGASTVAELCVLGAASVLVPLPGAPGDHQRRNAEHLVDAGAALLVDDEEAKAEHLAELIEPLLCDSERRVQMQQAARAIAPLDGALRVAGLVLEASGQRSRRRRLSR